MSGLKLRSRTRGFVWSRVFLALLPVWSLASVILLVINPEPYHLYRMSAWTAWLGGPLLAIFLGRHAIALDRLGAFDQSDLVNPLLLLSALIHVCGTIACLFQLRVWDELATVGASGGTAFIIIAALILSPILCLLVTYPAVLFSTAFFQRLALVNVPRDEMLLELPQ